MDAKDKRIAEQDLRIAELESQLKVALDKIATLQKNSTNSSKPPSSDIVKPPKPRKDKDRRRKIGAQKGHPKHQRPPFADDQIDTTVELKLEACPKCNGKLTPTDDAPKKQQQVELVEKPFIVTEYQQHRYWCEHCQCHHESKLPTEVKRAGLFGPNLISLTAYLKGRCHMSYKTMQDFYGDALRLKVSTGFLAKQIKKASDALKPFYDTLVARLPAEEHLHSDETGGKENGKKRWIWCLRAKDYTVFHVSPSRGSVVLEDLLGKDYSGIISSDFFSAYRKFGRESKVKHQFCWSHLIREVKFFAESKIKRVSRYGTRLLDEIRTMFRMLHRRHEFKLARNWLCRMRECRESILRIVRGRVPPDKDVQNLSERLRDCQDDYFRFFESDIPATNNLCEQSIRRVVIDRKITQGTRSDWGNRWCERIWSVLATCEQQGKNVLSFLQSAVRSLHEKRTTPNLLEK
jgi:transposase